jgi:hypothetical protein
MIPEIQSDGSDFTLKSIYGVEKNRRRDERSIEKRKKAKEKYLRGMIIGKKKRQYFLLRFSNNSLG